MFVKSKFACFLLVVWLLLGQVEAATKMMVVNNGKHYATTWGVLHPSLELASYLSPAGGCSEGSDICPTYVGQA